jgi:pantoate--beta-alanine ligase
MSSRNTLLSPEERKHAPLIYKTLTEVKNTKGTIPQIKKWVQGQINSNPFMQLEYFEIVNAETLMPVSSPNDGPALRACIAVKMGAVRLIDNIPF